MTNEYIELLTFTQNNNIDYRYFLNDKYIIVIHDIFIQNNVDKYVDSIDDEIIRYIGFYFHINKDYVRSIFYYLKAIDKNNSNAMNELGDYYYLVEQNYEKAIQYYLMAVEKNNCESMYSLGNYYNIIEKNRTHATYYF